MKVLETQIRFVWEHVKIFSGFLPKGCWEINILTGKDCPDPNEVDQLQSTFISNNKRTRDIIESSFNGNS